MELWRAILGAAGCGGMLRDEHGRWIAGYVMNVGVTTAYQAELWGILKGLEVTWDLGFRKAIIERDFRAA